MKLFYVIFAFVSVICSASSYAACPGVCVNEGGQAFYDNLCQSAGMANGRSGCEKYANFGCTYYQKQQVNLPGRCVNESGNPTYDSLCATSGQVYGQSQCDKYANLGCTWYAGQTVCR